MDTTLLLPPHLASLDLTRISRWPRARVCGASAMLSLPATATEASGGGHGAAASGPALSAAEAAADSADSLSHGFGATLAGPPDYRVASQ